MVRSPPLRVLCQQLSSPIQTRFRCASTSKMLRLATDINSQAHYAKGRRSLLKEAPTDLSAIGFSFYFTPLTGVLFTFRSRYYYAIGRPVVLSLRGWSPQIHAGFPVSGATWDPHGRTVAFRLRGCHPLRLAFPCHSPRHRLCNFLGFVGSPCESHYPDTATDLPLTRYRFGLFPVRSPLLRESSFLYFPAGT